MKKLTKEQVIKMHSHLIKETGGSPGIRDDSLLDSALNASFQLKVYCLVNKASKLGLFLC